MAMPIPLLPMIDDAQRFVQIYGGVIAQYPLQVYVSSLVFSPAGSLVRQAYVGEGPQWLEVLPTMDTNWSACMQTLYGHPTGIQFVTVSHGGTMLASVSYDGMIKIWDIQSGACLRTIQSGRIEKNRRFVSVAFSPDDRHMVFLDEVSSTITTRDIKTGTIMGVPVTVRCSEEIRAWALSQDSKKIVLFSLPSVQIRATQDGSILHNWPLATEESVAQPEDLLGVSPDGNAVAMYDGHSILVWNIREQNTRSYALGGYRGFLGQVAFSSNGKTLASALGGSLSLFDIRGSINSVQSVRMATTDTRYFTFSNTGRYTAVGGWSGEVEIVDAFSGVSFGAFPAHSSMSVGLIAFSKDDRYLVTGSWDRVVRIWELSAVLASVEAQEYEGPVEVVILSPDGTIATSLAECSIRLWDTNTGTCVRTLTNAEQNYMYSRDAAISHDNRYFALPSSNSSTDQCVLRLWNLTTDTPCLIAPNVPGAESGERWHISFSPNGKLYMAWESDQPAERTDPGTGDGAQNESDDGTSNGPDSTEAGTTDETASMVVGMWEPSNGQQLDTLRFELELSAVTVAPCDSTLALGDEAGTIMLWSISARAPLNSFRVVEDDTSNTNEERDIYWTDISALALAFSRDGEMLACVSRGFIRIFDATANFRTCRISIPIDAEASVRSRSVTFDPGCWYVSIERGSFSLFGMHDDGRNRTETNLSCDVSDDNWISWQGRKVLLVPPEYSDFDCRAGVILFGGPFGQLKVLRFSRDRFPYDA